MEPVTAEELEKALPAQVARGINAATLKNINDVINEPEFYEQFRENILSYTHVIKDGKFKIESYINAVKYVSYKMMGKTNIDAYSLTFPDRIKRFTKAKKTAKEISSIVAIYNRSKLVNLIYEQTLIPSWILNQDLYQKALNTQAELMITAKSEKVRSDAANSLLTHLKRPEATKLELDVTHKEDSSISELRQATLELARQQRLMIEAGQSSADDIAKSKIIDVTPEKVSNES